MATPDVDYPPSEYKDSADSISEISDFPIQAPEPSSPGNIPAPPLSPTAEHTSTNSTTRSSSAGLFDPALSRARRRKLDIINKLLSLGYLFHNMNAIPFQAYSTLQGATRHRYSSDSRCRIPKRWKIISY